MLSTGGGVLPKGSLVLDMGSAMCWGGWDTDKPSASHSHSS